MEKKNKTVTIRGRVDADLAKKFNDMCEFKGLNMSDFLRYLVEKEYTEIGPEIRHTQFLKSFGKK